MKRVKPVIFALATLCALSSCESTIKQANSPRPGADPEEQTVRQRGKTAKTSAQAETREAYAPYPDASQPDESEEPTVKKKSWLARLFSSKKERNKEEDTELAENPPAESGSAADRSAKPPAETKPKPASKPQPAAYVSNPPPSEHSMPEPSLDRNEPALPGGWRTAPGSPDQMTSSPAFSATTPPSSPERLPDPDLASATPDLPDTPTLTSPSFTPPVRPATPPAAAPPSTGTSVPGRPGYIRSPYGSHGLIEREGIASGSLIKCPYTGKWLRVP